MALINCPQCGKSVSDKAAVCPNCGLPIDEIVCDSKPNGKALPKSLTRVLSIFAIAILVNQFIFSGIYGLTSHSVVVIIASVFILVGTLLTKRSNYMLMAGLLLLAFCNLINIADMLMSPHP